MNKKMQTALTPLPVPTKNGKMVGGITGKGFLPGRSGNPLGAKASTRAQHQFGEELRKWLLQRTDIKDLDGKITKTTRLFTIVRRLADQKPEVLLHYAFGKPVEMHQVEAAEGTTVEFVVKVTGAEMP